MAQLPRYTSGAQATANRRIIERPTLPADTSMGDALQNIGKAGLEFAARAQRAKFDREVVTAENAAREKLDTLKREIEDDREIADDQVAGKYRESAEKILNDSAAIISGQSRRKDWQVHSQKWLAEGAEWTDRLVTTRQVDRTRAGHIAALADLETKAGNLSISPTTYEEMVKGERALIGRSVETGFLTEAQGAEQAAALDAALRRDQKSRKQASIDGLVRSGNRAEAVKLIEQEGSYEEKAGYYRVMEAVEDEIWQDAQRKRQADEQYRVELGRESSKTMDEMFFNKQLTPQWMRENRDRLSEADYTRGWNMLGNIAEGDVESNPSVFAELTYRSAAGEDVSGIAMQMLSEGALSKTDAGTIISRSGGNVEPWSKRGLDYITNALKPSDLNDDPARNLRFAGAVEEWREWASRQLTPPSRADMQKEMDAIVQSYSMVAPSQVAQIALPAPRTLGRRPQSEADMQEWQRQLTAAAPNMNTADLERELELLKKWQAAMSQTGAQ